MIHIISYPYIYISIKYLLMTTLQSCLIGGGASGLANNCCMFLTFGARFPAVWKTHEVLRHVHVELLQRLVGELHHKLITSKQGGVTGTHVPQHQCHSKLHSQAVPYTILCVRSVCRWVTCFIRHHRS